jgi:PBSX family phage terminase large subunit
MLVAWAVRYPNTWYVVMRRTYRELEDTTKRLMLQGEGGLPPALPPQLYGAGGYMKTDNMVRLHNGSHILFRSAENAFDAAAKVRGLNLAGFFIDQAEELEEDSYVMLYEQLLQRLSSHEGPGKALLSSNPGPETHWIYDRFVNPLTRQAQCRYVHATLMDNKKHLPRRYYEKMMRTRLTAPDQYERYILGKWGAFEGKRFRAWKDVDHVVDPFPIPHDWELIEGIDYGWKNPTCCVWVALDFRGRYFAVAEHYEAERPVSYHCQRIREIRRELALDPTASWLDPSAWAERGQYESPAYEFQEYGLFPARAENDRLGGWNRIDELLRERLDDGKPRLQVFRDRCPNLVRELPSLKIKDGSASDDVEKRNDHAPDALRYALMSRPLAPVVPSDDADRRDAYADRMLDSLTDAARGRRLYMGG